MAFKPPLIQFMKKINRLLDNKEFTLVLNKGKKAKVDGYLVTVKTNKEGHARIGISVSKKVGKAVVRVRVRRQIRAMIARFDVFSKHIDVVIIPKPSFLQNSFEQNLSNLKEALNKLLDGSVK